MSEKSVHEKQRRCANCVHRAVFWSEPPCVDCFDFPNKPRFKPISEESK